MPKHKINSISGRGKRHSILTGLVKFIAGLCDNTSIRSTENIGVGEIRLGFTSPDEPIEIREFYCVGNKHHIRIRAYSNEGFQTLYLFCHKSHFPKVVNYIIKYCEESER